MSELVEKVAKGLCAVEQDTGNITICKKVCPYCDASARAAIKAVAEWLAEKNHKNTHVPDWFTVAQLMRELEAKP